MSKRPRIVAALLAALVAAGAGGLVSMNYLAGAAEPGAAPAELKLAPSRITQVTVYPNSALVTREVEVPAGAGTLELVVSPLPPQTVNSSLYSEGSDGIRVLTTRFRTRPVKEDTREEVRKLEDEMKKLRLAAEKLQADVKVLAQNIQTFDKLENFTTASTQHATEKGKLDAEAAIALAKYLMEGRAEKNRELVGLQQQIQFNQEQQQFAQRQLQDLTAGSSKVERDAVIVVDKANGASGKVRLNYLVDSAAWRPQYKLRAGKDNEAVQVEYLAAVFQQTGEDWAGVDMILSTAQPTLNAAPPELKMLEVAVMSRGSVPPQTQGGSGQAGQPNQPFAQAPNPDFDRQAKDLRGRAQQELNRNEGKKASELYNSAAALEQSWELLSTSDQMKQQRQGSRRAAAEGPSVTYHLNTRLSVPSRNDEQVLEVAKLKMKPGYFYKAVPVLTAHVYRQANLTNDSKYVLLPGEATMYEGSDFVGRMSLPLVAIGEQFTAGFGVDPQLQIQRQMLDKSRATQGGNQVLKYEYRILVSSYKADKVKLQVWDRIPRGEADTVGVSLVKSEPEVCKDPLYLREDRPNNLLRWDVDVEPSMNGEKAAAIQYEFKLELDRQMMIGNIQSK